MPDGAHLSRSETADTYAAVVASSGRFRVVRCKDDLQFIVQRRKYEGAGGGKWPWRALAYVLDAKALPDVLQRPSLGIPHETQADLARRNLSDSQRAMAAAKVANMRLGDNQHEGRPNGPPPETPVSAADASATKALSAALPASIHGGADDCL
ncbi:MAG: hypothetical protein AAGJ53_05010 [Pseudomonadota bacterium]